jgi:fermentation-respiration switch protein FrsA (DUF1100 family)
MLIALESTTNRMNRLSTGFLYDVEPQLPEDTIKPYLAVTGDDIRAVAREILDEKKLAITLIAPSLVAAEIVENSCFSARPLFKSTFARKNDADDSDSHQENEA